MEQLSLDIIAAENLRERQLYYSLKEEELKELTQNRKERKKYALWLYVFLVGFNFLVFVIIFFEGFKCVNFILNNSVIITLLSATSANVIGIFVVVARYLFPKKLE